jgi:SM-20-related protein
LRGERPLAEQARASTATSIADALAGQGWAIADSFLPTEAVHALAKDARQRLAANGFRAAGVGAGARHAVREDVRGDIVLWLEPPGANPVQQQCLAQFETLRSALNRELQLGLFDFGCHYACYPPGAVYRRHVDRLAGDDRRVLSCILYLNDAWLAEDGGELRLHLPARARDVLPQAGTLVAFLSERLEHEVLPARRERLSLTGWFRRRAAAP